jgi:hypothetical protein
MSHATRESRGSAPSVPLKTTDCLLIRGGEYGVFQRGRGGQVDLCVEQVAEAKPKSAERYASRERSRRGGRCRSGVWLRRGRPSRRGTDARSPPPGVPARGCGESRECGFCPPRVKFTAFGVTRRDFRPFWRVPSQWSEGVGLGYEAHGGRACPRVKTPCFPGGRVCPDWSSGLSQKQKQRLERAYSVLLVVLVVRHAAFSDMNPSNSMGVPESHAD